MITGAAVAMAVSDAVWLPIVLGILGVFSGGGLAALVLIPANKKAAEARGQFEIVQANVLWAKELKDDAAKARSEVEQLRVRVRSITDELDAEIARRRAAESRLAEWATRYPPPETTAGDGGTT